MYVLGIDVGSSFLKSSILNLRDLRVEGSSSLPTPAFLPLAPERKEIPMEALAGAVKQLIDRAAEAYHLEGIVFSVQMHGFMLFTPQGGACTNYISWQDMRAMVPDGAGETLRDRVLREVPAELLRENGINLRPNHTLLPLTHYLRENPPAGPVEFAMIGDGLTRLLTGRRVPIHPSQAASSGLYSLKQGDWNRELIRRLGMEQVDFPQVSESSEPVAVYDSPCGGIPVYSALGDHQAAVLGICAGDGDMFINIGTGGQIGYVDHGVELGDYETRPLFQGRTIRAITQLPSGRSLNVLMGLVMDMGRELFGSEMPEKEIWRRLDALTGAEGIDPGALAVDFDFFTPQGGGISGIGGENLTARNLFYAAYQSMASAYRRASGTLLLPDETVAGIVCTGGVVRKNPLLLKCIAGQFPCPCRLSPYADDTMVGLMRYMLWCREGRPLFGEPFRMAEER